MKLKNNNPKIFIISGPSGAGEDTIIEKLAKKIKFNRVITTVTRPKRGQERQGQPYYFTTPEKFKQMIKKDEFIEWAVVYDNYRGCTKKELERLLKQKKPILWKVDWQGVQTIKKLVPDAISIFIMPPSYETLEKRLIKRGQDSIKDIKKRATFTKKWLKKKGIYDYTIINKDGKLQQTIAQAEKIVNS